MADIIPMDRVDEKELAEREEATQAYAEEKPKHYVDYLFDCVDTSVKAMLQVRQEQKNCWAVFNEDEPLNYAKKDSWQSKVTVPKPYSSVLSAAALVRKAFDAEFLSIENAQNEDDAKFIRDLMALQLSRTYANFPLLISDATTMGFAIGQSLEMVPQWINGGLTYAMIEPWKIHRDPDSVSRQPWSGMYWIHQEDFDYWVLKEGERDGIYQDVPFMGPGSKYTSRETNPDLTETEIARRKGMWTQRSKYRSMVRTSEFYGVVLAPNGELLLRDARFTVAGDSLIRKPKRSQYPTIRWPGVSFSPLPHLLRYDGRSLLQGIKSLWGFMNNLFCLHADNLNWKVNPPWELDTSALVDPMDVEVSPGKGTLTHGTQSGQQAFRFNEHKVDSGDILANMNFADQRFQEAVMLTYTAMGLPGSRGEVTAREAAQNLDQSMNVVGSMGKNIEDGALNAITAGYETVAVNITYEELTRLMGREVADVYYDPESRTNLTLPHLGGGSFRVSGISALMKDQEIIRSIREIIVKEMAPNELFQPYLQPYQICQAVEKRLYLRDEHCFVDKATADRVAEGQQKQQESLVSATEALKQAEAALIQAKILSEQAKAEMQSAKAREHLGKGELAMAKAASEGIPEPEKPGPVEKPEVDAAQAEALIARATESYHKAANLDAQSVLFLAQAHAAKNPPPPAGGAKATPKKTEKKQGGD